MLNFEYLFWFFTGPASKNQQQQIFDIQHSSRGVNLRDADDIKILTIKNPTDKSYLTMLQVLVSRNRPNSWIQGRGHSRGRRGDHHIPRRNAGSLITEKVPRGRIWFRCTRNWGGNSNCAYSRCRRDWGCYWRVDWFGGRWSNLKNWMNRSVI